MHPVGLIENIKYGFRSQLMCRIYWEISDYWAKGLPLVTRLIALNQSVPAKLIKLLFQFIDGKFQKFH